MNLTINVIAATRDKSFDQLMCTLFLKNRESGLSEFIEDLNSDRQKWCRTYRQFYYINFFSLWRRLYIQYVRPLLEAKSCCSLLDIGFGGGDIAVNLERWAKCDSYSLKIDAIEIDQRCLEFVRGKFPNSAVHFRLADTSTLVAEGKQYDFVISNNVIHHLDSEELAEMLVDAKRLSDVQVIFNDIERSDQAYLFFKYLAGPLFRRSYACVDGLTSIRRSYTRQELAALAPPGWEVKRLFPARLLLLHDKGYGHKIAL